MFGMYVMNKKKCKGISALSLEIRKLNKTLF